MDSARKSKAWRSFFLPFSHGFLRPPRETAANGMTFSKPPKRTVRFCRQAKTAYIRTIFIKKDERLRLSRLDALDMQICFFMRIKTIES